MCLGKRTREAESGLVRLGKRAWSQFSKDLKCFGYGLGLHPEQQRDAGTKEGDICA